MNGKRFILNEDDLPNEPQVLEEVKDLKGIKVVLPPKSEYAQWVDNKSKIRKPKGKVRKIRLIGHQNRMPAFQCNGLTKINRRCRNKTKNDNGHCHLH